jgi:penicillin-binding protein 2
MGPFFERRRWRSKEPKRERDRSTAGTSAFALLRALVLLMFGILVIQLVNLQVIKGDTYRELAAINALREVPIPAARGLIFDRNGTPLVENSARFSVAIVPGDLPERGEMGVYRMLSRVIGMEPKEIQRLVLEGIETQGAYSPTIIRDNLDREIALVLMELEPYAPGLEVIVQPTRRYLTGSLLSHVLGYVGPISAEEYAQLAGQGYLFQDFIGKSGVELTYERVLRGKPGKKLIEVDAFGRELRVISERRAVDGSNLVLTIDVDLQRRVMEVLREYSGNSDNAAAAVMNVRTGELLALVSLPTFNNNVFSAPLSDTDLRALLESPGKPLVNHLIADRYAPGSTFKTIVGAGALQEGIASPWTTITSRGYITVENEFDPNVLYVFPDWSSLGELDFYRGLAMSSNVYFYYLAGGKADEGFRGLGESRVARYARAFGLGAPTGIDLPGESPGLVPDAEWKEETLGEPWTVGDTYNFGIGQGYVAVTPLQMLAATAAVANGGQLLTPHVVKAIQDAHGNVIEALDTQPRERVPVQDEYLQVVRDAMRLSVTSGVARNAGVPGVEIAGKTGTAQFGQELPNGSYETHGWFVGFAPYDDPEIAVVVFMQRGSGGEDAAPAAAKIFDYYFNGPRLAATLEEPR